MNPRYQGPAVLPPASECRKQIETHLETLPGWDQKPQQALLVRKKEPEKAGQQGRHPGGTELASMWT